MSAWGPSKLVPLLLQQFNAGYQLVLGLLREAANPFEHRNRTVLLGEEDDVCFRHPTFSVDRNIAISKSVSIAKLRFSEALGAEVTS